MRVAIILGLLAAAASQASAFERTQLLCGMREHCVGGKCDTTKGMPGGTPVIVITPKGSKDLLELGRFEKGLFHADHEALLPTARRNLNGSFTYRFQTHDGGPEYLKIGPWKPQGEGTGESGDFKERLFEFSRTATVAGRKGTVVSTGECIDPTLVLLGYGMAPGIFRADELARRYADPKNREAMIAYCTLSPVRDKTTQDVEMWLYHEDADSPDLAFFGAPGSDALDALRRQKPPRENVFIDDNDKGRKLIVGQDGQSRFFERKWTEPGKPQKPYIEYAGLCRKGGEW
jgi:hypothetical protein